MEMGDTFRPGGLELTERAINFCEFKDNDAVLDIGCGVGKTVDYLNKKYNIKSIGLDSSSKMIKEAKVKYKDCNFILGSGENLPFANESFKGVFAECSISLSKKPECIIKEVHRVLDKDGWFIITDVYGKNTEHFTKLEQFVANGCIRNLHDLSILHERLKSWGFHISIVEDHSNYLRELLVKTVFSYSSMEKFWNVSSKSQIDGCEFNKVLKLCKPGYFMLIAKKGS